MYKRKELNPDGKVINRISILIASALLILALVAIAAMAMFTGRIGREVLKNGSGYGDLSSFNFDERIAGILHSSFVYYKSELYTPEDFAHGQVTGEPISLDGVVGRFDPGHFGTYRLTLDLPEGRTYGLSSYSAMYSQRLFINGSEVESTGVPGKTPETTIPKTRHYTVYFTPLSPKTEILIQFANFSHYDFGGIVPLFLGAQEKIMMRDAIAQQRVHLLVGVAVTASLFFLGMFFFFNKREAFLWFSLACLSIALRMLMLEEKTIMLLLPDLPWEIAIALEYLFLISLLYSFLLYVQSMFKGAIHRVAVWSYGALCALFALLVILLPPLTYTRFMLWFEYCSGLLGAYVVTVLITNVAKSQENRRPEHILILSGALSFILLSILQIEIHRSSGFTYGFGLGDVGMLVMIVVNMIALAVQFSRTEAELDLAREKEREMQETNLLLDRMSRLKSDFLANISHEMRTPLTVMASYAGLTAMQLQRGATNEKTLENLETIKRETIRLAGLVEGLKEVSLEKERQQTLEDVAPLSLLRKVVDFCQPICDKNKNKLTVRNYSGEVMVRVNPDSIFQTLLNLVINANRHTKEGSIVLSIQENHPHAGSDFVNITVEDNGTGIDPALIPKLFKRGVSEDSSSGLGLPICKEIIEEHGGRIWIESKKGEGTVVLFTLPKSKESEII